MRREFLGILCLAIALVASIPSRHHILYLPLTLRHQTRETPCRGEIVGVVFEDDDGDGRRDANEVGLPGVRMLLRFDDEPHIVVVLTDHSGHYELAPPPGRYQLHASNPDGYRWTTPHTWGIDIVCAAIRVDFGLAPLSDQ